MTNVLLVGFEQQSIDKTESYLNERKEFAIENSPSAKNAIERIRAAKFDVIVSELQISDMSGIEFLQLIRSQNDHIPFVIFTRNGNEETAIDALNSGANFYLKRRDESEEDLRGLADSTRKAMHLDDSSSQSTINKGSIADTKLNLLSHITVHDIQNQIVVLNGLIYKAKHSNGPVQTKEYLNRMQQVADKIQSHIAFARDYQNLGKAPPLWIRLDNSIQDLTTKFDSKWVQFELNLGSLEIFADAMLNRAFYNLIDDTMKHGQKATRIKASASLQGENLLLIYEDNGVGVPIERKNTIFEKNPTTQKMHGLVLVKEILAITGMTIKETGEPGSGARFEIVVPKGNFRYPIGDQTKPK